MFDDLSPTHKFRLIIIFMICLTVLLLYETHMTNEVTKSISIKSNDLTTATVSN